MARSSGSLLRFALLVVAGLLAPLALALSGSGSGSADAAWIDRLKLRHIKPSSYGRTATRVFFPQNSLDTSSADQLTKFYVEKDKESEWEISGGVRLAKLRFSTNTMYDRSYGYCDGPIRANDEIRSARVTRACLLEGIFFGLTKNNELYKARTADSQGTVIMEGKKFVDIACANGYALAVSANGEMYVWGSDFSSLPLPQKSSYYPIVFPVDLLFGKNVSAVAASAWSSASTVLARDGTALLLGTQQSVRSVAGAVFDPASSIIAVDGVLCYVFRRNSLVYYRWTHENMTVVRETIRPVDRRGNALKGITGVHDAVALTFGRSNRGFVAIANDKKTVLWHDHTERLSYAAMADDISRAAAGGGDDLMRLESVVALAAKGHDKGVVLHNSKDGSAMYIGTRRLWIPPVSPGKGIGAAVVVLLAPVPFLLAATLSWALCIAWPYFKSRKAVLVSKSATVAPSRLHFIGASIALVCCAVPLAAYVGLRSYIVADWLALDSRIVLCYYPVPIIITAVGCAVVPVLFIVFLALGIVSCARDRCGGRGTIVSVPAALAGMLFPAAGEAALSFVMYYYVPRHLSDPVAIMYVKVVTGYCIPLAASICTLGAFVLVLRALRCRVAVEAADGVKLQRRVGGMAYRPLDE